MLIRSQDKETLINFNNSIVVNTMVDIGGVTKIHAMIMLSGIIHQKKKP